MLRHISISNVALIKNLNIDFDEGFSVLTGETGAGKSIIVDAVNLVIGERADKSLIKYGEEKALVEAIFSIENNAKAIKMLDDYGLLEGEKEAIFSRELSISGKNVCRINGRLCNVSVLKEISSYLIDIHGQHEHQSLLNSATHLQILDMYSGTSVQELLKKYREERSKYKDVLKKIKNILGEGNKEQRIDILNYQLSEINSANLIEGEEDDLKAKRNLLINMQKILTALNSAYQYINGDLVEQSALSLVKSASNEIMSISNINKKYEDLNEKLANTYYSLEDIAYELGGMLEMDDYDEKEIDFIEERLETISKLKRKYGNSYEEIINFRDDIQKELDMLKNSQSILNDLEKQKTVLQKSIFELASDISLKRRENAVEFEKEVIEELNSLGMEKSLFKVVFNERPFSFDESEFNDSGFDTVEFMISLNIGQPLKQLTKVVSGGEASRIMLALKSIYSYKDDISTMVFDEIDTGISGRIAGVVGEKIKKTAKNKQILCITHLPQIAAAAKYHYLVEKTQTDNETVTTICKLNEKQRIEELAKMMGDGAITESALNHAKDLLRN